jgi:hypothetical protein
MKTKNPNLKPPYTPLTPLKKQYVWRLSLNVSHSLMNSTRHCSNANPNLRQFYDNEAMQIEESDHPTPHCGIAYLAINTAPRADGLCYRPTVCFYPDSVGRNLNF